MSLVEFTRAPAATQAAFFEAVGRQRVEECAMNRRVQHTHGIVPRGHLARVRWDERWRSRAYRDRMIEQRGRRIDDGFDAEKAHLEGIEAIDYVFRLTGAEPNRAGYVHCPLPNHDERTPSFNCKGTRWRCYGCGSRGSIYELAGILWDLPRSGIDFRRIHERLTELFG